MSSAVKALLPTLRRGIQTSSLSRAGAGGKSGVTHTEICYGDGHTGNRPNYNYDFEHGPNYLNPSTIPGFKKKYAIIMPLIFGTAIGIPIFAVWWQQYKLKN